MIVAAHQPHYMPWLGYLDKMAKADLFVVMDDLQYEPQNFQNRQRLKNVPWLAVPLSRGTQADRICDKQIDNSGSPKQHWQRRHWLTIEHNYRRAPYFDTYADDIHDVYMRSWTHLLDLDLEMLAIARRHFGITTPMILSSSLQLAGHKTERLIHLCTSLGARCYLSGGGGSTDYLDSEAMGRAGIGLIWQHFHHPVHAQRNGAFASHLGFLDLLFNCGPASRDILFAPTHPIQVAA